MPENEPNIDLMAQYKEEYEAALRDIDPLGPTKAIDVLHGYQGAIPFFELGLKLGKEDPEKAKALITDIKEELAKREQQIAEMLYPYRRKK